MYRFDELNRTAFVSKDRRTGKLFGQKPGRRRRRRRRRRGIFVIRLIH